VRAKPTQKKQLQILAAGAHQTNEGLLQYILNHSSDSENDDEAYVPFTGREQEVDDDEGRDFVGLTSGGRNEKILEADQTFN
jgi:hypothetical protein